MSSATLLQYLLVREALNNRLPYELSPRYIEDSNELALEAMMNNPFEDRVPFLGGSVNEDPMTTNFPMYPSFTLYSTAYENKIRKHLIKKRQREEQWRREREKERKMRKQASPTSLAGLISAFLNRREAEDPEKRALYTLLMQRAVSDPNVLFSPMEIQRDLMMTWGGDPQAPLGIDYSTLVRAAATRQIMNELALRQALEAVLEKKNAL